MTRRRAVAVLWRGDEHARRVGVASNERLRPVFEALAGAGIHATPVVYRDELAPAVREELLSFDGVLVWVDPIKHGSDRRCLDEVLRDVSAAGVFVSAHPDVVQRMGTKDVLVRTRELGWGTDVHRIDTPGQLRAGLPGRLVSGPRVLKPQRGNGGIGVWKVELVTPGDTTPNPLVRVQGAEVRDTTVEVVHLDELLDRCAPHFRSGVVVDQRFHPHVSEGLIRCYLVADEVVGFARQRAGELLTDPEAAVRIMGLPSAKTMHPPDTPALAPLRDLVEHRWVPAMLDPLGLRTGELPLLWDADFLLGTPTESGEDTYVLCEINCSCVTPFPPEAPAAIARTLVERLRA